MQPCTQHRTDTPVLCSQGLQAQLGFALKSRTGLQKAEVKGPLSAVTLKHGSGSAMVSQEDTGFVLFPTKPSCSRTAHGNGVMLGFICL